MTNNPHQDRTAETPSHPNPNTVGEPNGVLTLGKLHVKLAPISKSNRESERRRLLQSEDFNTRLSNPVRLRIDPIELIDIKFATDLVSETAGEKGLFVEEVEGNLFGFISLAVLEQSGGDLFAELESVIRKLDTSKEALLLFHRAVAVKEASADRQIKVARYQLVKVKMLRTEVEVKGVSLPAKTGDDANRGGER